MKINRCIILIIFLSFACVMGISNPEKPGRLADKPKAEDILADFRAAVTSLKSFSQVCSRVDKADDFVETRHKAALKEYEPILSKLELLTRKKLIQDMKPEYKTVLDYSFIKPFSMQVTLKINDYLPSLMNGSIAYYRPEVNNKEIFLKEPILGIVFRKPITNDSATVMVCNSVYDLLEVDCALKNGGKASFAGTEVVDGKEAYSVKITLKKGETPWKAGCGGNDYGIPGSAHTQLNRELGLIGDRLDKYGDKGAYILYRFDKEMHLTVKKTMRFRDEVYIDQSVENIKLNKVDAKKLLTPKKSKD